MDFGSWTSDGRDPVRRRRLALGYVAGAVSVAACIGVAMLRARAVQAAQEDEIRDVQLATEPEAQPEPEPPPPEPVAQPKPRPRLVAPVAVPLDKPAEKEPVAAAGAGEDDDPFAKDEDDAPAPAPTATQVVKVEPPPPSKPVVVAPKRPAGPVAITEDVTPPQVISMPQPAYPPGAKAEGIEGTVVVKMVITEAGSVTGAQAVRGPDALRGACLAAVQSARFRPALLDGKPLSVHKIHQCRFKIRT